MRSCGRVLAVGCVLLVAACISPEEQRAMDQQKCLGFGFPPGTYGFAQCMMSVTQQREAQQAADDRAWMERISREGQQHDRNGWHHDWHGDGRCKSTTATIGNTTTTREFCHW